MAENVWLKTHFKIMDIAAPLLNFLSNLASISDLSAEDPILVTTAVALAQWASAYNHVTRRRRQNVLKFAASRSEHLLDVEDSFASEEGAKNLFGQSFLATMLRKANQELTLKEIEAVQGGPSGMQQIGRWKTKQSWWPR